MYVANEQGGSVTMYHAIHHPINWLLEPKQSLSTLPTDFKGTNACAEIRLHPSNRFLRRQIGGSKRPAPGIMSRDDACEVKVDADRFVERDHP